MRIDWDTIRLEYVTGDVSQRELCDKHKVSQTALSRRALKEGWLKEREKYKRKLGTKIKEEIAKKQSKKLTQLIAATENLTKTVNQKSKAILKQAKDPEKAAVVSSKELLQLTKATKDLIEMMRDVYDIPKNVQENTVQLVLSGELEEFTK